MKKISIILLLIATIALFSPLIVTAQTDAELLGKAKKLMMQERDYEKAMEYFELIKLKYPDSKYVDDAEFWSAYTLEQQGKEEDSFVAYQGMINKYPDSPWVDDAISHQIGLAEKFVKLGEKSYLDFLSDKLESSNKSVKYQAALSMGKLGDRRAIPALNEMTDNGDRDMRSMANSLLHSFEPRRIKYRSQIKPMPYVPPKARTDKKDRIIKQPGMEPTRKQFEPKQRPQIKNIRPAPKPQTQKTTPSKK